MIVCLLFWSLAAYALFTGKVFWLAKFIDGTATPELYANYLAVSSLGNEQQTFPIRIKYRRLDLP